MHYLFLMIQRPPTSTLFPTRRSSDLLIVQDAPEPGHVAAPVQHLTDDAPVVIEAPRSEEHTSELQSRPHLVCRLLLEKKNFKSGDYSHVRLVCIDVVRSCYRGFYFWL